MNAAVFLTAAVVSVPVFKRLKLGSVLGYLAAGAVIGPFGAGFISDAQRVLHFAEFGVVLLLFIIGLELKPSRLWSLRRDIFGLGLSQVMVTGAILSGIGWLLGLALSTALVVGFGLALSSTAFALQILEEKGELNSSHGNTAFAILLFQDMAIVPLLALVAVLGPSTPSADPLWLDIVKVVGVIAAILVIGKYLLNPALRFIAKTKASEIFTAAALLLVVVAALMVSAVGMSMALGAFLAGVLLADSEFRHQLETDIEPFRGLLLGLFFIAVGMSVDWSLVLHNWLTVLGVVLGLVFVKALLIYPLCRLFGSPDRDAQRVAVTLSQGGEFAFVLFSAAVLGGVMDRELSNLLIPAVTLSMASTPLLGAVHEAALKALAREHTGDLIDASEADPRKVIVVGFGRVGQVVAQIMKAASYEVTAIDFDPKRIRIARDFGNKVYFGDVTRPDLLKTAGAEHAEVIFICVDDPEASTRAIRYIRDRFPNIAIIARASDRTHVLDLMDCDVTAYVRETFESSVLLGVAGLRRLGTEELMIDHLIAEFRHRDEERLHIQKQQGILAGMDRMSAPYDLSGD